MDKRETFQELVAGPNIAAFADTMAASIVDAVDDLANRARDGAPVDAIDEMARIVYRAITRIFIGDKISIEQADQIGRSLMDANAALRTRLMLPFVPFSVPLPGDRAFRRAVQSVDDLVYPIVRDAARRGADGDDIVSRLIRAGFEPDLPQQCAVTSIGMKLPGCGSVVRRQGTSPASRRHVRTRRHRSLRRAWRRLPQAIRWWSAARSS